ncbi:secretory lipase [Neokomagataea thailandica NBRC 106555]|nr:secretory lipase [Neokomagataea thailandica NBRC 106555]
MKDVYYGSLRVFDLASAGFVLVMTDYHGLGTDGPHQYMNKYAQVADIRNAVPAAHALMPELSQKWFVVGHSQGAYAALATAEAETKANDAGYLGAVSIAPAARPGMMNANISAVKKAGGPYMSWLAFAIKAQYPEFKPEDLLSKKGLKFYPEATGGACWLTGNALYYPYSAKELVRPDWNKNKYVKQFFAEQTVGYEKTLGPILLVAGGGDTTIPIRTLNSYYKDACHLGSDIKYLVVPNAEHGAAMVESMDTQISWLKSVLAGNTPASSCPKN